MDKIRKRLNKKGFTLAELLIVVAIIGVLVAVSIPIFNSNLEKAREVTDVANMRAAKAAATVQYLSDSKTGTFYYDAEEGVLKDKKDGIAAYGQGTKTKGGITWESSYDGTNETIGQIIQVVISVTAADANAEAALDQLEITWVAAN